MSEALAGLAPTIDAVNEPASVDLSEYDCVISAGFSYARLQGIEHPKSLEWNYQSAETDLSWWVGHQEFPPHLSIVYLFDDTPPEVLDFRPTPWESEDVPHRVIMTERRVPGRLIRYLEGLPTEIGQLVQQQMASRAQRRSDHVVLAERSRAATDGDGDAPINVAAPDAADELTLRPLLLGPSDQILAATYERSAEASVWLLPLDLIEDLRPWVVAAFREWHELYPRRFPEVPDWQRSEQWETSTETDLRLKIEEVDRELAAARERYDKDRAELDGALQQAQVAADSYERVLLTGTGTPLEDSVLRALVDVGFQVQNMDDHWPDDARREDFRVTDVDEPGWIAICEVKGFQKGVSESGLLSLQRSAMFYTSDEGKPPSAQWYVANSFLGQDPASRQNPLQGRVDAVTVFEQSFGLLVDTRSLFRLLQLTERDNTLTKDAARSLLRRHKGVLTVADVDSWVAGTISTKAAEDGAGGEG